MVTSVHGLVDGGRVEMKNLPSVRAVLRGSWHEARRQAEILARGELIERETRGYDVELDESRRMRSKEDLPDYRFAPEPDLAPMVLTSGHLQQALETAPPSIDTILSDLQVKGLSFSEAVALTMEPGAVSFLTSAIENRPSSLFPTIAKLLQNELLGRLRSQDDDLEQEIGAIDTSSQIEPWSSEGIQNAVHAPKSALSQSPVTPIQLADLADLLDANKISSKSAKKIVDIWMGDASPPKSCTDPSSATSIVDAANLWIISDPAQIEKWCQDAIDQDPKAAAEVAERWLGPRQHQKAAGRLIGQVLKASKGAADPAIATEILRKKLSQIYHS